MRPIDADALVESLSASYKELRALSDSLNEGDVAKEIYQGELITFLEAILRTKEAPTLDYAPVRHSEWVLTESPYAEYEEGVDGESHDRWTCRLCGGEAGFDCDPDGFASFQDKTKFCGHCGARMDGKENI